MACHGGFSLHNEGRPGSFVWILLSTSLCVRDFLSILILFYLDGVARFSTTEESVEICKLTK
jgi:hypothetical protein